MPNTFIVSDTHFSHRGIVKFIRADGVTKERPWDNIEEMDEALIENWNSVVRPTDTVIHLGDVVINRSALSILGKLNGVKKLVKGNHDVFRLEEYTPYFKDILGSKSYDDFILTHIPVHEASIERWKGNIHGHLHSNRVMQTVNLGWGLKVHPDPRYLCVSMEHINYTPISWEDCKKRFEEQQYVP